MINTHYNGTYTLIVRPKLGTRAVQPTPESEGAHNHDYEQRRGNGRYLSVTSGGIAPAASRPVIAEQERPDYRLPSHLGRDIDVRG